MLYLLQIERKIIEIKVKKYGINSTEVKAESNKLYKMLYKYYKIREFPRGASISKFYEESFDALKKLSMRNNVFPTIREWNKYAMDNNYLGNVSMQYISNLKWKELGQIVMIMV